MQVICDNLNSMYFVGRTVFLWDVEYHTVAIDCDTLVVNEIVVSTVQSAPRRELYEDVESLSSEESVHANRNIGMLGPTPYSPVSTGSQGGADDTDDFAAVYYRETS